VSVINQFVKKNAQRAAAKSIPINIKQTLNCLSALTNRATRQHKYHMTGPAKGGGVSVVVVAVVIIVVAGCFHKQTTHISPAAHKMFSTNL